MNGFYVNAVGWVLTVNVHALDRQEARELSDLWILLMRARAQDSHGAHFLDRLLFPRYIPLSDMSREAFGVLLDRMAVLHPDRFGEKPLSHRRDHWLLQSVASLLLGFLAIWLLPLNWPLVREVVQTLFLMGIGFIAPTITLGRASQAAKYFANRRRAPQSQLQRSGG